MMTFNCGEFEKYAAEAKDKWGETAAYKEHQSKTANYSGDKWSSIAEDMNGIMSEFAECMKKGEAAASAKAQGLVKTLQNHISENYYLCTNEILAGLGQMYVCDERFKNNIDKHTEGTAEYISQAIKTYCAKN